MKSYPIRLSGTCPGCDNNFFFKPETVAASGTTDCGHCGLLLIIDNNRVYDFHEKLNHDNPAWPKDGHGTAFVELKG